jgi:hypothetical protein
MAIITALVQGRACSKTLNFLTNWLRKESGCQGEITTGIPYCEIVRPGLKRCSGTGRDAFSKSIALFCQDSDMVCLVTGNCLCECPRSERSRHCLVEEQ